MLMIYGVTAIAAGAALTSAAGHTFSTNTLPVHLRRAIGGETFGVLVAALMGLGLVMLFAFVVADKSQDPILLEALVAGAVAVAGYFGIRLIDRLARKAAGAGMPLPIEPLDVFVPADPDRPAPGANPRKRAA